MKKIQKMLLTGCGYTVLILALFYIFAGISKFTSQSIAPGQFALIALFGFIISLAEFAYDILSIKKIYKSILHYVVLLIAFCAIFIFAGNIKAQNPSVIFVAIVIYSVLYFAILAIASFAKKTVNKADKALDARLVKKNTKPSKPAKSTYKPLYKDGE